MENVFSSLKGLPRKSLFLASLCPAENLDLGPASETFSWSTRKRCELGTEGVGPSRFPTVNSFKVILLQQSPLCTSPPMSHCHETSLTSSSGVRSLQSWLSWGHLCTSAWDAICSNELSPSRSMLKAEKSPCIQTNTDHSSFCRHCAKHREFTYLFNRYLWSSCYVP